MRPLGGDRWWACMSSLSNGRYQNEVNRFEDKAGFGSGFGRSTCTATTYSNLQLVQQLPISFTPIHYSSLGKCLLMGLELYGPPFSFLFSGGMNSAILCLRCRDLPYRPRKQVRKPRKTCNINTQTRCNTESNPAVR